MSATRPPTTDRLGSVRDNAEVLDRYEQKTSREAVTEGIFPQIDEIELLAYSTLPPTVVPSEPRDEPDD